MTSLPPLPLAANATVVPPGTTEGREIELTNLGLDFGWALLLFLALAIAAIWSYRRWAAELGRWQIALPAGFRVLTLLLLAALVTLPVLSITTYQPVRQSLLVLIDASQSMSIEDQRSESDDIVRAGIATGAIDPRGGLEQRPPGGQDLQRISRVGILEALRDNNRLDLWSRLAERADLEFYAFGRTADPLPYVDGQPAPHPEFDREQTAMGDAIRQVLDASRGQSIAGVMVATDGANNSGVPPLEAARLARADGVPLYLYGVGIELPRDLILRGVEGPRLTFANERVDFRVRLHGSNLEGRTTALVLRAGDEELARETFTIADGDMEMSIGYTPERAGDQEIAIEAIPLDDEANQDNNSASTPIRIIDDEIKVLYVEQEPRWDFRYLLATLQRDRRLSVHAYLFDGDPDLHEDEDSPFLESLPATREELFSYQIIILGDVDPQSLGEERMQLIEEWVGEVAGGIIFLAGTKFNPIAYAGTAVEPLLPVEVDTAIPSEAYMQRYPELSPIQLTPSGEISNYFQASPDGAENRRVWEQFPGVRWTATVGRARPGAEVIAVDPNPMKARREGSMPVIAMQTYGAGQSIYFGTDETYRWRSRTGETHYITIWGQVIQGLSLERMMGASQLVQLRSSRPRYFTGDTVVLSGAIYRPGFEPLAAPSVPGTLSILRPGPDDGDLVEVDSREIAAMADPSSIGEYAVEFVARTPGTYQYRSLQDPEAVVEFEVREARLELLETGMNADLLQQMAELSNGRYFREETLDQLPELLEERSATIPVYEQIKLYPSPWWLLALIVFLCSEWTARRLLRLK